MLLDSTEINTIESNLISLFDRTFKKGIKGQSGPKLQNSVKLAFSSKTFEKQIDSLIDDIYLYTIDFTDKLIQKTLKAGLQRIPTKRHLSAAKTDRPETPFVLTEEAVKECAGLADEVVESIIRVLKDEAIYQEHPRVLARRILDLWGGERYRAVRWARTFSADVATNTSLYQFKQQGIEECQFYARIDGRTSPQCRMMHGTVWKVDSPEARQYKCPLHQNCRSVILPLTSFSKVDDSLRYENRDFTKQVNQDFKPLEEGIDEKAMKKIFKEIDTFNEKWAVPSWVFDEDVEKRIAKLGVEVESKVPKIKTPKTKTTKMKKVKTKEAILKDLEDGIRNRTLEDGEKGYLIDNAGKVIFEKVGKERSIRFTNEELKLMRNNILTHSHPSGGSFSPDDVVLSCYHELNEIRAAGKYRTYILKTKSGASLHVDYWNEYIKPNYENISEDVKTEFLEKIASGEMSYDGANALHWHEVWSRVFKNVDILDYSYTDVKAIPK